VEIHPSAHRHQFPDADISYAYERATAWVELGDDPSRYLAAGPTEQATSSSSSFLNFLTPCS
jgi:hypothetical protein